MPSVMKEFEKDYRKWSRIALISIVMLLFTIATIDAFLGFDFSRNMYLMTIVAVGCVMALISLSWITILNTKLMRTDLVQPVKRDSKEMTDDRKVTEEDIELLIRKEGYVPQKDADRLIFKITGESYEVYYHDECFTLVKRFNIGDDIDKDLLRQACLQAQDELFMFRGYVHTFDNGQAVLCFEVGTYVNSVSELEKYFTQYLNILLHAIDRHREIYLKLDEAQQKKLDERANPVSVEAKVVS